MLNRRSLRVKALQNIYAFDQCQKANYELALEEIKAAFAPDLNSMEEQNLGLLEENKKNAQRIFRENFNHLKIDIQEGGEIEPVIRSAVDHAFRFYNENGAKDKKFLKNLMVTEAEKVNNRYLSVLLLLAEFGSLASGDRFKKPEKFRSINLLNNKVIKAINDDSAIQQEAIRKNISWSNHGAEVLHWYRDLLSKDETFLEYQKISDPGLEDDKNIIKHITKNLIFKHETIQLFFEEIDLYWEEDRAIVKSMVLKTIKSVEVAEDGTSELEQSQLSYNWEDDRDFFEKLFLETIANDSDYEEKIAVKAKNWDIDRLALIDKIIIKMAICEMINFPSIPVKVTINEYIELSKNYSTPKSKQFVNGILDVLAEEMMAEGLVKKSGRGLIDNK
ncbi:transcription antitermination factor NusB [Fulvivirgaceae bacterium BMA10]|uniref:Transcription antitermination protein NusB n=1 Tax=Splendidivirga corallicola TaxID=3051826 RepID=A0ABT8KKF1_9BACT|nr:transcription antitermination factor NusB [Fulvivirgaceae bacterium BMA10]